MFLSYKKIIAIFLFIVLFFILFFTYSKGILLYDEGWVVNPAARILSGQVPYRDFHYIYTPGAAYLTAISLFLFGNSIIASRIIVFIISLLSTLLIILISRKLKFNFFATLISVIIYTVFAPLNINFSWPVMYALFASLLTVYLLIRAETENKLNFYIFAGIASALTIFFKQNFGLAAMICGLIFIFFLISKNKFLKIKNFTLGFLLFLGTWFSYMHLTNSLIPFFKDFYYFMIEQIIFNRVQETPFIYPAPFFEQVLKTIFYLSPLIISLFAIFVLKNKQKIYLIIPIFVMSFYLLGIRPTTDYTHLVPLISLTGLPLGMILIFSKRKSIKLFTIIISAVLIFTSSYAFINRGYYKWNPPIFENTFKVEVKKVNVLVSKDAFDIISSLMPYVNKYSKKGDNIFVYRFSPLLYFIFDRRNPTKFEFLPINILSKSDQKEIINALIKTNTKLVISDFNIKEESSLLNTFVIRNFNNASEIKGYTVWVKK